MLKYNSARTWIGGIRLLDVCMISQWAEDHKWIKINTFTLYKSHHESDLFVHIRRMTPPSDCINLLVVCQTGHFVWLDGAHWKYADWLPGEPNNTADVEDCIELLRFGKKRTVAKLNWKDTDKLLFLLLCWTKYEFAPEFLIIFVCLSANGQFNDFTCWEPQSFVCSYFLSWIYSSLGLFSFCFFVWYGAKFSCFFMHGKITSWKASGPTTLLLQGPPLDLLLTSEHQDF